MRRRNGATMEDNIQFGLGLVKAKRFVWHGEWEKWIEAHIKDIRIRQVQIYMALARDADKARYCKSIEDWGRVVSEARKSAIKDRRTENIEQAVNSLGRSQKNWVVHHADNRRFSWPMVDHIVTDPPWSKIEDYEWLAEMALEKMRLGGLLLVQCRQAQMSKVFSIFERFTYHWTLAIIYGQGDGDLQSNFIPNWSPVLVFSKGEPLNQRGVTNGPVTDTVTVKNNDLVKTYHVWQQPLRPLVHWIPALTQPGDLIADPFAGTGTVGLACKLTGRRYVGVEKDAELVKIARMRLVREAK